MPRREPLEVRFWKKVSKYGVLWTDPETKTTSHCWDWIGAMTRNGYGNIADDYDADIGIKILKAYRVSWELAYGDIPNGMEVCHKCDNPRCVNPQHLFLGTHSDNMDDMKRKGRGYWQTHPEESKEHMRQIRITHPMTPEHRKRVGDSARERFRGEGTHLAKLTNEVVISIRSDYPTKTLRQIAEERGITESAVSLIVNRKRWKHI